MNWRKSIQAEEFNEKISFSLIITFFIWITFI